MLQGTYNGITSTYTSIRYEQLIHLHPWEEKYRIFHAQTLYKVRHVSLISLPTWYVEWGLPGHFKQVFLLIDTSREKCKWCPTYSTWKIFYESTWVRIIYIRRIVVKGLRYWVASNQARKLDEATKECLAIEAHNNCILNLQACILHVQGNIAGKTALPSSSCVLWLFDIYVLSLAVQLCKILRPSLCLSHY